MHALPIPIPTEPLQEFCQRNHIRRLAVFGSALREGDGLMDRFEELREKIVPLLKPYVKRVAVFGSFAHGEDTPDSDIDLLVALKPSGERPPLGLNWFGLWAEIEQRLGRKVDLVTEDALSPYIRPYVERERVVLYAEEK